MNLLHSVYFQFIIEGMEECASEGLDDLVHSRKDTFLKVKCQYLLSNHLTISLMHTLLC